MYTKNYLHTVEIITAISATKKEKIGRKTIYIPLIVRKGNTIRWGKKTNAYLQIYSQKAYYY